MVEIIGEHMMPVFEAIGIFPKNTYQGSIGYWKHFEVWELTEDQFNKIVAMPDDEFESVAIDGSWWRSAEGSNLGSINEIFLINDKSIRAWRNEYLVDDLHITWEELPAEERVEYKDFEDYCDVWLPKYYNNILEYFCEEFGVSTEKNVCALATDLAKQNDMSIADLFKIYG